MSQRNNKLDALGNETCLNCGAPVSIKYGPDIRFTPPCNNPMMYRAECGADCLDPSWTAFTRERALEMWNTGTAQRRKG